MTLEQIQGLKIPLTSLTEDMCIYVESAIQWINQNTTLDYDPENLPDDMPANVKLFIAKFCEILKNAPTSGVTSESIEGLSQSFADGNDQLALIRQYANMLIGEYMLGDVIAVPYCDRWC